MEGAGAVLCSLLFGDCDASSLLYAYLTSLDVLSLLQSCRALHHLISSGGPSVQMLLTRLLAKRAVASNFIDWDRAVVKVEIRPSCLNDFDCLRSLSASEQSVGDKVVCCPRVQQSGSVRRGLSDACLLHSSSGSTLVAAVYNCNRLHVECGYGVTDGFASATRSYDLQCFPHTESDDSPPISCVVALGNDGDVLAGFYDGSLSCHDLQAAKPGLAKWAVADTHGDRVMALERYGDGGSCVLSGSRTHEKNVRVHDIRCRNGQEGRTESSIALSTRSCVYSLAALGTPTQIAVGGQRDVQLFDLRRASCPFSTIDLRYEGAVLALRYSQPLAGVFFGTKRGFLGWASLDHMDSALSIYDRSANVQPNCASQSAVRTLQSGGAAAYGSYGATGVRSILCAEASRRVLTCNNDGTVKAFALRPDSPFCGGRSIVDVRDWPPAAAVPDNGSGSQFTFLAGSPGVAVFCGGLHGLLFVLVGRGQGEGWGKY